MNPNLPTNISQVAEPVPFENTTKKIIMFGNSTCPDCARAKSFFTNHAIEYEYHDIDQEKESKKWVSTFTTINPVIILSNGNILYEPTDQLLSELFLSEKPASVNLKEPQTFDTIIIGAGPSGISAAIYAVRKSLKVLVITKTVGGQAVLSGDIENLIGFTMITGSDLAKRFRDELERFKGENLPNGEAGIWLKEGVEVTSIEGSEGNFAVKTANSGYAGKTVIIASGRKPRMLNIPGEKEFFGKGVATCATCDAPLFKGKEVVIVGGGNSAMDAALSLLTWTSRITLVNVTESLKGDDVMLRKILSSPKIKVLNKHQVVEISGKQFVESVKVESMDSHQQTVLSASGVFVEIGWVPSTDFVPQLAKDKQNQIIVDEFGQTSIPGIWACGDVNNLWGEQIIIAAGEGAKTALIVAEHLNKIPHQTTSNIHMG